MSVFVLVSTLDGTFAVDEKSSKVAFQKGLQAENAGEWAEAIQYYVEARKLDPSAPWGEQGVTRVFERLVRLNLPLQEYRVLVPDDLHESLVRRGVIPSTDDPQLEFQRISRFIWIGLGTFLLLVLGFVIYVFVWGKKRQAEEQRLAELMHAKRKAVRAPSGGASGASIPKKVDVKITEKTREEMNTLFTSIHSIVQDEKALSGPVEVDVEGLKDSGVVNAFIEEWLSKVQTDETAQGRFSKMTIDGALVFDEDEKEGQKNET